MLIIFTGGRGSGKSTIARILYSKLDDAHFDYEHQWSWRSRANTRFRRIRYYLYFLTFLNIRICSVFFLRLYRDIKNKRSKGSLSRILMPFMFSYHLDKLKRKRVNCIIYESDFLGWSVDKAHDNYFDPKEVVSYFSNVILPLVNKMIVVVCDTPTDHAVRRWNDRESKNFSEEEISEWVKKKEAWKNARNIMITTVSKIEGLKVLHLDGLNAPEINAQKIVDTIGRQL